MPLDILYAETHNSGLVGKVWEKHHLEFSNFISKFGPKKICEIGGGHGVLSENYAKQKDFDIWEIFEPNSIANINNKIVTVRLFSESKVNEKLLFTLTYLNICTIIHLCSMQFTSR